MTEHENPSFKAERSTEPCNEDKVSSAEVLARLRKEHPDFKGDWSHLERLVRQLDEDAAEEGMKAEDRLTVWNQWSNRALFSEPREYVHLEGASLADAHLEGASLILAHLEGASLEEAHLEGAHIRLANLDLADLTSVNGLRFNENRVHRARIPGNAKDPWSVLRRGYTGPWFFVHLLLLTMFFTPYVAKIFYLSAVSDAHMLIERKAETLADELSEYDTLKRFYDTQTARFEDAHERKRAVWVLIGWTESWWSFGMAMVIVLYNAMRGFLTLKVSSLRDAEERSEITPRLDEYWRLFQIHRVARVIVHAAVAFVLWNAGSWIWSTWLWVPR